jgi:3'-phosphoadenosine 5'-phosphosulfate sulfotransferase (PAPS reductase)/FAD synthetase
MRLETMHHFRFDGPAVISFSGGRTSAYLLWCILQAYGGVLPDDVVVVFANTGMERPETLRFVQDCASHWGVHIHWLEYRGRSGPSETRFEVVGQNGASMDGSPFRQLIVDRSFTPNSNMRFCTEDMKVNVIMHFVLATYGWETWANVVGLRYDEGRRVLKQIAKNDDGSTIWKTAMPLSKAKITKRDVMEFWAGQDFDLQLKGSQGNCTLCFLKGRNTLVHLIRANPELADWWIEMEEIVGKGSFSSRFTYRDLKREATSQPLFPGLDIPFEDEEFDTECGLACEPDLEPA